MPQKQKKGNPTQKVQQFISHDIWRITENEVSGLRRQSFKAIKTVLLSARRFNSDKLDNKASALTYSTLLAIVPILALLFAIAGGLGFKSLIESQLVDFFPGHKNEIVKMLQFSAAYLDHAKGGVFVGIGLLILFWAIMSLIGKIEDAFNNIWHVKKPRTFYRKFTDYFSLFLFLPVMMVVSSGLSIFITAETANLDLFSPIVTFFIKLSPFFISWLILFFLYIFLPNTKVKFKHAIIPSIVGSLAYQGFQYLYINGQIWVTSYNAIYGSFAALPLLLLWLQVSWLIVLFGAMLTYSSQNVKNYNFERDSKNISRRYKDFIILSVASVVVRRFVDGQTPLSADQISYRFGIPIRLTADVLYRLTEIGVLSESINIDNDLRIYQPAIDINQISVGLIFDRLDQFGSEDFKIDNELLFANQWKTILGSRAAMSKDYSAILVKDLV